MKREDRIENIEPHASVERFEDFKTSLQGYSAEQLIHLLDEQMDEQAEALVVSYYRPGLAATAEDRRKSALDFAVVAMAREPLAQESSVPEDPFTIPSWLGFASVKLTEYTAQNREARQALERTIFFSSNPAARLTFSHMVSASVTPYGNYDKLALATGVATGRVHAELL